MSDQDDYEVGYKKPPKHTQFQPGQSGNPKGRPSGTKNLTTDLAEELAETITVTEGGKLTVVSKQRAMLKAAMAKALKGDMRATGLLLGQIVGVEQAQAGATDATVLAAEDRAILEAYEERLIAKTRSIDRGDDHDDNG